MDFYGFYTGRIFDAYKYLGAHIEGEKTVFRTFAPSASRISVIGEFNQWEESPMENVHDGNFWEFATDEAKPGMMYKYRIYDQTGRWIDHCDPYGYGMGHTNGTTGFRHQRRANVSWADGHVTSELFSDGDAVNLYGCFGDPDENEKYFNYLYPDATELIEI